MSCTDENGKMEAMCQELNQEASKVEDYSNPAVSSSPAPWNPTPLFLHSEKCIDQRDIEGSITHVTDKQVAFASCSGEDGDDCANCMEEYKAHMIPIKDYLLTTVRYIKERQFEMCSSCTEQCDGSVTIKEASLVDCVDLIVCPFVQNLKIWRRMATLMPHYSCYAK